MPNIENFKRIVSTALIAGVGVVAPATVNPVRGMLEGTAGASVLEKPSVRGDLFTLNGVPGSVDAGSMDLATHEPFTNTIGLGSEGFIAEPGTLLVGPDFGFNANHEMLSLEEIAQQLADARGHIEYFNPVNQEVIGTLAPYFWNVPEGGYIFASGAQMKVQLGNQTVDLKGEEGHNWFLIVRGRNADGQRDSDLNLTARFSKYIPGHIEVERYPAGDAGFTGGFISEGQFKQKAEGAHNGDTNCGAEGCTKLSVLMLDVNTGGYTVIRQNQPNGQWELVDSNFANKS